MPTNNSIDDNIPNKLVFKPVKQEYTFNHTGEDMKRIFKIVKHQNKLLLEELAHHYHWDYNELIKKYVK